MASGISHSDSLMQLTESENLPEKSSMNTKDDDDEEEEEEATVPKSNEQTIFTTPLLSNKNNLPSQISLSSNSSKSTGEYLDICRICHCEGTIDEPLISPCLCLGTMRYLHQSCLQRWIKSAGVKSCELCKFDFIMHSELKPFKQVRSITSNGCISIENLNLVAKIRNECGRTTKDHVFGRI